MAALNMLVVIVVVAMLAFQLWMASSSHPTAVRLNSLAGVSFLVGWIARANENFWIVPAGIIVLMVWLVCYRRVSR